MGAFHVANFGCRASQSEGAAIAEELAGSGAASADSPYAADVVIVNTCTVTAEADRDARQTIARIGARNPAARIRVTGCSAQRAPEELAALPGVRWVGGDSQKAMRAVLALASLDDADAAAKGRAEIFCSDIFLERNLKPSSHDGSGGRTRAIVKLQDGCNANCSFCIIPAVRGRSRSLDPAGAIAETAALAARGYREVVFSGIHLGTYGRDLPVKTSLFALVSSVLERVPGLKRARQLGIPLIKISRRTKLIQSVRKPFSV
jgi:threonylcarbamoyladenosine tRNA methylthiotransferase MtaB